MNFLKRTTLTFEKIMPVVVTNVPSSKCELLLPGVNSLLCISSKLEISSRGLVGFRLFWGQGHFAGAMPLRVYHIRETHSIICDHFQGHESPEGFSPASSWMKALLQSHPKCLQVDASTVPTVVSRKLHAVAPPGHCVLPSNPTLTFRSSRMRWKYLIKLAASTPSPPPVFKRLLSSQDVFVSFTFWSLNGYEVLCFDFYYPGAFSFQRGSKQTISENFKELS